MALGTFFTPASFTPRLYDEVIKRLEAAGAGAPAGRLHHIALETDGQIRVLDIWDSADSFHAFGATLVPVLAGLGIDPGEPQVSAVYNSMNGGSEAKPVDAGHSDDRPAPVRLVRPTPAR
jgi:hypothetical protein